MTTKLTHLIFYFCVFVTFAQNKKQFTVSGMVLDKDNNYPLEYATVTIIDPDTNSITEGGITNNEGKFNLSIEGGIFNFRIEYFSYKTIELNAITIDKDIDFGTISMAYDVQALDNVDIIAEKTTVELKLDKKIYNVGKDLTVQGGSVSDVLDNVPSVSVDVEGNVALRGNNNVRILINGKPSGLVGLNSTEALRMLPADAIEKVEIITSPSARYEAEGTAGILNIILRRSKLLGFNGSFVINAGYPENYSASTNVNYRTQKLNIFTNAGISKSLVPGESETKTQYFNTSFDDDGVLLEDLPDTFRNEYRDFERDRRGFNSNTGFEYYFSDRTTLTSAFLIRKSDNKNETFNRAVQMDNNGQVVDESLRYDPENETDETTQFSTNFETQFSEDSDHKLTVDFQIENNSEDENSIIFNNDEIAERVQTIESQNRWFLKSDFVLPLKNNGRFEAGYNGQYTSNTTDYTLEFFEDGIFTIDPNVSNGLEYIEKVNALYTQYGKQLNKFNILLGLRMESSVIKINQLDTNLNNTKRYTDFFPTINFGYKWNESTSITLGYNRRISRPRSRFLNPFPSRSSATNLFQGNPDLDPSYAQTLDLGVLKQINKLTLNSSIYYSHATGEFTFVSEDTGEEVILDGVTLPVIRRGPINLADNKRIGFEFTINYNPSKTWSINGDINLFESRTSGTYKGLSYDADNFSWLARINNKITLPGKIEWQTRLSYRGPTQDAVNRRDGIFSTNMAFSKDLFKGKGSIALNIDDVFNSRRRQLSSTTPTFNADSSFRWRVRSATLSFTYRIKQDQSKKRQNKRESNSFEDNDFGG